MCEFCKNHDKYTIYRVPLRSTYADDNLCEKIVDDNCGTCNCGCADENYHFTLYKSKNWIQLGFHRKLADLIISPFSELLHINYCPWCGEKLSDKDKTFDECCVRKLVETNR